MVDKKVTHLQSDFESFKTTTTINKSTLVLDVKSHSPLLNVAAAAIALGTLAWLYEKYTSI
ncbi:BnaCnng53980D [Brassica napus]|uniref:(rape) hypothetical protein n=1 Tax=Brassica napus TaxID=3708 RepID=A0A078JPB0_BRANA|nr:unnamed protein product [Brassica napus]CDY67222.1 BnaCnng53980D [Brassica napus]